MSEDSIRGADAELIAAFLAGESRSVFKVRSWVRSQIARSMAGKDAEAEDLEQDVLLELIQSVESESFRGESRFETYVRTFCRFKVIDELRRRGRKTFVPIEDLPLVDGRPGPQDRIGERQEAARLRRFLDLLGDDCTSLWRMIFDGLSYEEMSQRTGVAQGTLRVRVHRCRKRAAQLRKKLG